MELFDTYVKLLYIALRVLRISYLLYWVEFWVIEVSEEPEDTWSEDLPEEEDEGGKVEHIHHPHQPVDKHGGPWSCMETGLPVLQCSIEHRLQTTKTINISRLPD